MDGICQLHVYPILLIHYIWCTGLLVGPKFHFIGIQFNCIFLCGRDNHFICASFPKLWYCKQMYRHTGGEKDRWRNGQIKQMADYSWLKTGRENEDTTFLLSIAHSTRILTCNVTHRTRLFTCNVDCILTIPFGEGNQFTRDDWLRSKFKHHTVCWQKSSWSRFVLCDPTSNMATKDSG